MKTLHSTLLVVAAASIGSLSTGCFEGPNGIPGNHAGNDAPIVVTDAPGGVSSLEFDVTFTAYDPDSDEVTLWDACPNPDAPDAAPILTVGYSVDGGSSFSPVDPADLELDGAALVVPTCGEVKRFDDSIRIAVSTSGEQHTLTWNSFDYVPTSADVTFRVAVNDGSLQSEPGDSEEFIVANLPAFDVIPKGLRPGDSVTGAELSGVLTHWDGTTTIGSGDNLTLTNFVATSTTMGTIDITMGPDDEQILRPFILVTPGAGVPSGDELAEGSLWTCAELGQPIVEFETSVLGGGAQFVCSLAGGWEVDGSLTTGDQDFYEFVASSSGDYSFSLNWGGSTGDVDDYDAYLFNAETGLASCDDDLLGCACATVAKPEVGTITGLVAGQTYILYISHYAGAELPYTVDVGN